MHHADAMTEYSAHRELDASRRQADGDNERLGILVHELRNSLQAAMLAFRVLESGSLPIGGSTGALLKRSLDGLSNLLDRSMQEVRLHAGTPDAADVKDHCGGLPVGLSERMFRPFTQGSADRTGLGMDLSIARRTVEGEGGSLTVRDVAGTGCVFTMSLPRHAL